MQEKASHIFDETRTPLEHFQQELEKLGENTILDDDTRARKMDMLTDEYNTAMDKEAKKNKLKDRKAGEFKQVEASLIGLTPVSSVTEQKVHDVVLHKNTAQMIRLLAKISTGMTGVPEAG